MKSILFVILTVILILAVYVTANIIANRSVVGTNKASIADYVGNIDSINCDKMKGWVWDESMPDTSLEVKVYVDGDNKSGNLLYTGMSDIERPEIASLLTKDNGKHGFDIDTPVYLKDNKEHELYFYARNVMTDLSGIIEGSPKKIYCIK